MHLAVPTLCGCSQLLPLEVHEQPAAQATHWLDCCPHPQQFAPPPDPHEAQGAEHWHAYVLTVNERAVKATVMATNADVNKLRRFSDIVTSFW